MSDLVPSDEWERLERAVDSGRYESTLRFATALVLDGMTGVSLVLPREPGLLARARAAAQEAGVEVRADHVGSETITLRFRASGGLGEPRADAAGR